MNDQQQLSDFEKTVGDQSDGNIFSDFWYFLRNNKKWWLLPIIVILVLLGGLLMLSGTAVAPFIYTLF